MGTQRKQHDSSGAVREAAGVSGAIPTTPVPKRRSVLYPNAYVWFIFVAALDIMLTYLILNPAMFSHDMDMTMPRGSETNALADWVINRWDVPGMVVFKFLLVILVIGLCEIIGRYRDDTGRMLARWAIAVTSIPVLLALIQMGLDLYFWFYPPA